MCDVDCNGISSSHSRGIYVHSITGTCVVTMGVMSDDGLESIQGAGPATLERLKDDGVETVDELAACDPEDLENLGEAKSKKLIKRANEKTILVQSGSDVEQEYLSRNVLPTGVDPLDHMMDGGIREGDIVGIAGPSSVGKTQFLFKAMVSAVEETGNPAIYIETERDTYQPQRIQELANEDDTQSKIHRIQVDTLEKQYTAYNKTSKIPEQYDNIDKVSLVCVDSFTSQFRLTDKFEDRSSLSSRNSEFGKHLRAIMDMTDTLGCPALLTMQVYGNPTQYGGAHVTWGGELVAHTLSYRFIMTNGKGSLQKLMVSGHPGVDDGEVYISIQEHDLIGKLDS